MAPSSMNVWLRHCPLWTNVGAILFSLNFHQTSEFLLFLLMSGHVLILYAILCIFRRRTKLLSIVHKLRITNEKEEQKENDQRNRMTFF